MADLGNLWFSLGLDDSKFEKEWNNAIKKYSNGKKIPIGLDFDAKKFKDATKALQTFQKFKGKTKIKLDVQISQSTIDALRQLAQLTSSGNYNWKDVQKAARAAGQYARELERVQRASDGVNKSYKKQSLWVQNLHTMAANYLSLFAGGRFVSELARITGEFELQKRTLQAMVGEFEGSQLYNQIKELSVVSPFQFKDLASYTKQLAAFSVPYNEIYDTTKSLADISAGLGVDMSRIILAYGQIRSAGVLRGTELRQLTEAGVPILEELAEKFTALEGRAVSVGEVFGKISQKLVPFEMVKDILTEMTSEGGKFFNMQEIQADTLAGKISNLKDAYQIMMSDVGRGIEDKLKGGIDRMFNALKNYERIGKTIVPLASLFGMSQFVKVIQHGWGAWTKFTSGIEAATTGMTLFSKAAQIAKMNAASIIGVLFSVGIAIYRAQTETQRFQKSINKLADADFSKFNKEVDILDKLKKKLEEATDGSYNREQAINQIKSNYGEYLTDMQKEALAAGDIASAYRDINDALRQKAHYQALENAQAELDNSKFGKDYSDWYKKVFDSFALSSNYDTEFQGRITKTIEELFKQNFYSEDRIIPIEKLNKWITGKLKEKYDIYITELSKNKIAEFGSAINAYLTQLEYTKSLVNSKFQRIYDTEAEEKAIKEINELYKKRTEEINNTLNGEKRQKALLDAEKTRLKSLIALYENKELGTENKDLAADYKKQLAQLDPVLDEWVKKANKAIKESGAIGVTPKKDDSYLSYLNSLQDRYDDLIKDKGILDKKLEEGLLGGDEDKMLKNTNKQIEALEAVAAALNYDLSNKTTKSADRTAVELLEAEYKSYKKQYDKYKELLSKGVKEDVAKEVIATSFSVALPEDENVVEFYEQKFKEIADKAITYGKEIGGNLYDSIYNNLGTSETKDFEDLFKITEEITNELQKWGLKDFQPGGLGVSKILEEYLTNYNKITAKQKDLQDKLLKAQKGDEASIQALKLQYGEDWFEKTKEQIDALALLEIKNNKEVARDKIKSVAESISDKAIKDSFGEGFMQSLGNKSIAELNQAIKTIDNINPARFIAVGMTSEQLDELKENLTEIGLSYEEFIKIVNKGTSGEKVSILNEKFKKTRELVLSLGNSLSNVLGSFSELASANGDSGLASLLDNLKEVNGIAFNVAGSFEKIAQTDEAGNVTEKMSINWANMAAAAAQVVTFVAKAIIAQREYANEMERAEKSFRESITTASLETAVLGERLETIFGTDVINALKADMDAIDMLEGKLKSLMYEVMDTTIITNKGFLGMGKNSKTLREFAPALFNATGNASYELLENFLNEYGDKLDDVQKSTIQTIIDNYKVLQDATDDIEGYLEDAFSDTASTIADRMIEAFAATGDAATNLGDLVHSIGKSMAKDLIQSLLIEQYLSPAINRIKGLYSPKDARYEADPLLRTQKSILALQDAMAAAQDAIPEVNAILQALQGIGVDFSEGAENASNVLSGLTEDQQNLLMGYVNGIRADVSFNKGMLTSIVNSVGIINNNIATALVVWKQIETNTHRSADGVDKIIEYFEGIVGPYDGGEGQAFRVNIA